MSANKDGHWIEHAHLNKGSFTRKAKAKGESVGELADEDADKPGVTGKQARLAKTFRSKSFRKR